MPTAADSLLLRPVVGSVEGEDGRYRRRPKCGPAAAGGYAQTGPQEAGHGSSRPAFPSFQAIQQGPGHLVAACPEAD